MKNSTIPFILYLALCAGVGEWEVSLAVFFNRQISVTIPFWDKLLGWPLILDWLQVSLVCLLGVVLAGYVIWMNETN